MSDRKRIFIYRDTIDGGGSGKILKDLLFYFDNEESIKNLFKNTSKTINGMFTTHKWENPQGINVKDIISMEW